MYVVTVTILSLYMALFPTKSSQLLDATAIEKYCEEMADADFTDEDDCLRNASLHFRRNELIFINVQCLIQLHFIHVIWTHSKNSDLPRAEGGCQPNLRQQNIQMQHVQMRSLSAINDEYMPTLQRNQNAAEYSIDSLESPRGDTETSVELQ